MDSTAPFWALLRSNSAWHGTWHCRRMRLSALYATAHRPVEALVTKPDFHDHDPSANYPPSRPTLTMLFVAIAVVAAAVALVNWPQVSAFAHVSEIKHAVGF
jgi:hypothetical protein